MVARLYKTNYLDSRTSNDRIMSYKAIFTREQHRDQKMTQEWLEMAPTLDEN